MFDVSFRTRTSNIQHRTSNIERISKKHRPRIVRAACPRRRRRSSRARARELVTTGRSTPPFVRSTQCRLILHAPARRSAKPARRCPSVPKLSRPKGGLLIRTNPRTCRSRGVFQHRLVAKRESNPLPSDYQSDALPLSYSQSSLHAVPKLFTERSRSIQAQTASAASRRG